MKKHFPKIIFLGLIACQISIGFAQQKVDTKVEAEKIQQALNDWRRRGAIGNIDSVMFYWHDDVIVMNAGQPMIKGKADVRKMMENIYKIPGFEMNWDEKPVYLQVSESVDMAYLILQNTFYMNDPSGKKVPQRNKTLQIWKKASDGYWKAVVVSMNTDPNP